MATEKGDFDSPRITNAGQTRVSHALTTGESIEFDGAHVIGDGPHN